MTDYTLRLRPLMGGGEANSSWLFSYTAWFVFWIECEAMLPPAPPAKGFTLTFA